MRFLVILLLTGVVFGFACAQKTESGKTETPAQKGEAPVPAEEATPQGDTAQKAAQPAEEIKTDNPLVLMQTNHGDILVEIYAKEMPIHGGNFLKLVDEGFYDSLTIHRIVPGFVIQGGDPLGTGFGGPPGRLEDEPSPYKHDRGTVAMARSQAGASKSQFYINLANNYRLDTMGFAVFARVVRGMDVVDKIAGLPTGPQDRPQEPVIMLKVVRQK